MKKSLALALAAGLAVATTSTDVQAQAAFTAFDTIIDFPAMAAAAATLGGTVLVLAFTLGGGFRIAKKAYSWIFSKM